MQNSPHNKKILHKKTQQPQIFMYLATDLKYMKQISNYSKVLIPLSHRHKGNKSIKDLNNNQPH